MKWILLFSVTSLLFMNAALSVYKPQVIYGSDNRLDLFEIKDPSVLNAARSTAAVFNRSSLKLEGTVYQILSGTFGQEFNMCESEPYFDQKAGANCSAFLVAEDMVATAGHCITQTSCKDMAFAFDFALMTPQSNPQVLSADLVYFCDRVLERELNSVTDYALVKLDRVVQNREPLKLALQSPAVNSEVTVIGHPAGIPTKVAAGAQVRRSQTGYFVASLDTYGGNSGSAVFSSTTLEVVGILVRGEKDYSYDSDLRCNVSNTCSETSCRGEDVTHIEYIRDALVKVQNVPAAVTYLE
jgi:hypothetical protein